MSTRRRSVAVVTMSLLMPVAFMVASSGVTRGAVAGGADLFKAKCAMCHSADGSGSSAMGKRFGVRDLRSPDVQGQSDARLTEIITNGKDKMPAFGARLSGDDIQNLVAYIRGLK